MRPQPSAREARVVGRQVPQWWRPCARGAGGASRALFPGRDGRGGSRGRRLHRTDGPPPRTPCNQAPGARGKGPRAGGARGEHHRRPAAVLCRGSRRGARPRGGGGAQGVAGLPGARRGPRLPVAPAKVARGDELDDAHRAAGHRPARAHGPRRRGGARGVGLGLRGPRGLGAVQRDARAVDPPLHGHRPRRQGAPRLARLGRPPHPALRLVARLREGPAPRARDVLPERREQEPDRRPASARPGLLPGPRRDRRRGGGRSPCGGAARRRRGLRPREADADGRGARGDGGPRLPRVRRRRRGRRGGRAAAVCAGGRGEGRGPPHRAADRLPLAVRAPVAAARDRRLGAAPAPRRGPLGRRQPAGAAGVLRGGG
mmetsp:Transcript_33776/g.80157  ORF Transcript_33776/g.80157 Transcript_33776/m.80157 type:complete len:373 (+) Transcript_33776:912-2030(+)